MHDIGIYSRLDQVFDAPLAVKDVLIGQFGLDNSVCFRTYVCQFLCYGHRWNFGH